MTRDAEVSVRVGDPDDYRAAMNVLDGAMLDVDPARVRAGLGVAAEGDGEGDRDGDDDDVGGDGDGGKTDSGEAVVLVAEGDGSVLGALVLDGRRVTAVAVRRSRRDRGVGTALVEAAAARRSRVTASFDARVKPFYGSLGFDIRPAGDGEDGCRFEGELGSE